MKMSRAPGFISRLVGARARLIMTQLQYETTVTITVILTLSVNYQSATFLHIAITNY